MKKTLCFLAYILVSNWSFAQVKHDYNWLIGEGTIPDNTI